MLNKITHIVNKILHRNQPQRKRDLIAAFFLRHKKLFMIFAASTVAILLLLLAFNLYQKSAQEKYSAIFHQSLIDEEKGEIDTAKQGLQQIYQSTLVPSGVKALASLRYAGLLLNSGSVDEALKVYAEIANSSRYEHYLRELSGLLAAKILVIKTDSTSDKANQQEALKQIEKFESRSKDLHSQFAEQKGIFFMKIGELDKSYQVFAEIIKDSNSEQSLKLRVADMIKILSAEGFVAK